MTEWLAGNRIRGTSAEKPVLGLQSPSVGGWVEVARHKLGSDQSTIDVSWTDDKRYYMILMDYTQTSDFAGLHRLGNSSIDPNNNYHNRQSVNGGGEASSQATYVRLDNGWQSGDRKFAVEYIADLTNKEKLIMNHMIRSVTTGKTQTTGRSEVVSKWVPSTASDTVGKFQMMNGGNYASGSEVVVLGWDQTDTHTTNFWEELADVTASGSSTNISSGTITAKKYLCFQFYTDGTAGDKQLVFNNDGSSGNYVRRFSSNGGADDPNQSLNNIANMVAIGTTPCFSNSFVINNSSTEKLHMCDMVRQNTAGATTAPSRFESANKWANTSAQITQIDVNSTSGNFTTATRLRVWGSD